MTGISLHLLQNMRLQRRQGSPLSHQPASMSFSNLNLKLMIPWCNGFSEHNTRVCRLYRSAKALVEMLASEPRDSGGASVNRSDLLTCGRSGSRGLRRLPATLPHRMSSIRIQGSHSPRFRATEARHRCIAIELVRDHRLSKPKSGCSSTRT